MPDNRLDGTWRLVSWENQDSAGKITFPVGRDARGYIIYTADGYVSVQIMTAQRQRFAADDLLQGSTDEKARAAETFIAYAGRYELASDTVMHHVELSLFPNWVGTRQVRRIEMAGDRLTLSAGPMMLAGGQQIARLIWERMRPSSGSA